MFCSVTGCQRHTGPKGNDVIAGRSGNDVLYGEGAGLGDNPLYAGNDTLSGDGGNDYLVGEVGVDSLTGGTGADHFNFHKLTHSGVGNGSRDKITDFEQGIDIIEARYFDETPDFDGFTFIGTAALPVACGGEVRYTINAGGNTIISLRVDTSGGADMQIELTGAINLTAQDFIFCGSSPDDRDGLRYTDGSAPRLRALPSHHIQGCSGALTQICCRWMMR